LIQVNQAFLAPTNTGCLQNRRQKVFNRGALSFCGGTWHSKIDKNSTDW